MISCTEGLALADHRQILAAIEQGRKLLSAAGVRPEQIPQIILASLPEGDTRAALYDPCPPHIVCAVNSPAWSPEEIRERWEAGIASTPSNSHIFLHEMGHALGPMELPDKAPDHFESIAWKVSKYACKSTDEFLAECFPVLILGGELSFEALQLYKQLGGFIPSGVRRG